MDLPMGQLRINEDEQDLDWALKQGIVTPAEYQSLLEDSGLVPTDIVMM